MQTILYLYGVGIRDNIKLIRVWFEINCATVYSFNVYSLIALHNISVSFILDLK